MTTNAIAVPFHGAKLYIVEHNGEPYAPMKPIVEGMGLDWKSQYTKIKQRFASCVVEITMQLNGDQQKRSVVCLPVRKLFGWLSTISPNKVRAEIRETIITYQNECDDVLWQHWTKGSVAPKPQKLTADQCRALQEAVQARVDHLPPQRKGGAYPKLWGAVKSHYRVPSYRELPQEKFDDALSLIGRLPLEGEHLPAMTNPEIPDPLYLNLPRDTANPKYGPYNGMLSADALCYGFGALSNPADELFRTLRQAVKTGRPIIVKDIEGAFIVYHMTRRYCWQYRALLHDFKKIADAYLNRGPHYTDNIVDRPPTDPA